MRDCQVLDIVVESGFLWGIDPARFALDNTLFYGTFPIRNSNRNSRIKHVTKTCEAFSHPCKLHIGGQANGKQDEVSREAKHLSSVGRMTIANVGEPLPCGI